MLFLIELLLKGALLPWADFIRSARNQFDLLITSACFVMTLVVYLPNGFDDPSGEQGARGEGVGRGEGEVLSLESSDTHSLH